MAARKDHTTELERIERKLDRLTRLVWLILLAQPLILVGLLLPDLTMQAILLALIGVIVLLAIFPNAERKLPKAMRSLGRFVGSVRRRVRSLVPG